MTLYVTLIDMSAAFDTIHSGKLLKIAEDALSEDSESATNRYSDRNKNQRRNYYSFYK